MAGDRSSKKLTVEFPIPNQDRKLKELIIYVSDKCAEKPEFGATVLNKILWASDFYSYVQTGMPITGQKYQRLERGPAPLKLVPLRNEMVRDQEIHIREQDYRGRTQNRVVALRNADLSLFTGTEIALVDQVIDALGRLNAAEVSSWSHGRAWKTRFDGQLMPYESALLSDDRPTPGDIARTEQLAREYGWNVEQGIGSRAVA